MILLKAIRRTCGQILKNIGCIDCKIMMFEVKNFLFFLHLAKQGQQILNILGLIFFPLLKVEVFYVIIKTKPHKMVVFIP
jgi:hypothetical protein